MTTTAAPRPLAVIDDDLRRYRQRLTIAAVQASSHWVNDTKRRINELTAERAAAVNLAARKAA